MGEGGRIPARTAVEIDEQLALLGLRALFVLVEGLIKRFRYLDETIAIILAVVAVKLMLEDVYKLPPEASLGLVLALLGGGIAASVIADRREEAAS